MRAPTLLDQVEQRPLSDRSSSGEGIHPPVCRLQGSQVLRLAAYRSKEVDLGRGGKRPPLELVVSELQPDSGDIIVNLDQAGAAAL